MDTDNLLAEHQQVTDCQPPVHLQSSPKYCLTVGHLLAKSWLTGFCTKTYNDSTVPSNGSIKMHLHGS